MTHSDIFAPSETVLRNVWIAMRILAISITFAILVKRTQTVTSVLHHVNSNRNHNRDPNRDWIDHDSKG